MSAKAKENLIVTVCGVTLFAVLFHLSSVLNFLSRVFLLIRPIVVGAILAIFIHVPVNGIEKRLTRLTQGLKKKPSAKLLHIVSFVLALLCILLVLVLVLTLLIPELVHSAQSLYAQVKERLPQWLMYLDSFGIHQEGLEQFLAGLNLDQILPNFSQQIDTILVNIASTLSSTVSLAVTIGFALIIRRAIQLDPNCVEYRQVLQQYQYTTQSYQQHSQEFHMDLNGMSRMCLGLCCVNYMCRMYAFGC